MTDDLSLDDIEGILAQPDSPGKKTRARKVSTDTRDISTWLKLQHTSHREGCAIPEHDEVVAAAGMEGRPRTKGMVVFINDVPTCRLCFLAGK